MHPQKINILVLEDDPGDIEFLKAQVEDIPQFKLWITTRIADAAYILQKQAIDVILTDLHLPDGDELSTFEHLHEEFPKTPIVILTGMDDDEVAKQAIKNGAQDYLIKGETDGKMLERVIQYAIERKDTETRSENQHHQELESARFESVGRLAKGVAHEVLNPLSIITMSAETLLEDPELDQIRRGQLLHDILEAATRCAKIANAMVDFSSHHELKYEDTNLHELLDGALDMLKHHWEKQGVEIIRSYEKDRISPLRLDPVLMRHALINLFSNSLAAMPNGGRVHLCTLLDDEHRKVYVTISDTGSGIPKEYLDRVFDPFFTTKNQWKDLGLGLSVVKRIVASHQGHVQIDNELDTGTCVTISLPI